MILRKGAEAEIDVIEFLGEESIRKRRVTKEYRLEELDRKLRVTRTRKEARLLSVLKDMGLLAPCIYFLDTRAGTIVMEYVKGWRLKDLIDQISDEDGTEDRAASLIEAILERVGRDVGTMHAGGITHGDLTTSNMLLYESDAQVLLDPAGSGSIPEPGQIPVYYIDLSLGEKGAATENMGEDLDVFRKAFESTHPSLLRHLDHFWKGYDGAFSGHTEVRERLDEIRRRARYR